MEACSLLVNLREGMHSSSEQPLVGRILVEAKGTCALFLFLLAAKKRAVIVSFR